MNTEQEIKTALGERIKKLREEKGLSQMEVAYRCDMGISHLSKIENGHTMPGVFILIKIAKVIGVNFTEITFILNHYTAPDKKRAG